QTNPPLTLAEARRKGIEVAEMGYLEEQLSKHKGKIQAVAVAAGITTRQLHKLMKKYNLHKESYK
ncbi:MAG: helix-turn-helix domain-containing protein, partial [Deltaproteobacteria bacterium]